VERSDKHVEEFGENIEVIWKTAATAIVVHVKTEALNLVCRLLNAHLIVQKQLHATVRHHLIRPKIL